MASLTINIYALGSVFRFSVPLNNVNLVTYHPSDIIQIIYQGNNKPSTGGTIWKMGRCVTGNGGVQLPDNTWLNESRPLAGGTILVVDTQNLALVEFKL